MISLDYLEELCSEEQMRKIGLRLKYARRKYNSHEKEEKLTQLKMAEYLRIDRQRIISIENGKTPINFMELIYYSKICRFSIDELLFDEVEFNKPYFEDTKYEPDIIIDEGEEYEEIDYD